MFLMSAGRAAMRTGDDGSIISGPAASFGDKSGCIPSMLQLDCRGANDGRGGGKSLSIGATTSGLMVFLLKLNLEKRPPTFLIWSRNALARSSLSTSSANVPKDFSMTGSEKMFLKERSLRFLFTSSRSKCSLLAAGVADDVRHDAVVLATDVDDTGLAPAEDGRELKGELLGLLAGELPKTIKFS